MWIREMNDYGLMRAIVDSDCPVVMAFVERGTPPSGPLEADLDGLAREFREGVIFGIVDVAENPSVLDKLGLPEPPCVALFRDGRHLATSRALDRFDLSAFIQRVFKEQG